jgi:hypothetical protein
MPGPGEYKMTPLWVYKNEAPAYSVPLDEYAERQHLVDIGRGEGKVGPGSYNTNTNGMGTGPGYSFPQDEYPERRYLVDIGRGEGKVGPGSYNTNTNGMGTGPAYTFPLDEYPERNFVTEIANGAGKVGPGSYDPGVWDRDGPAWTIGWEKRLAGNVPKCDLFVREQEALLACKMLDAAKRKGGTDA